MGWLYVGWGIVRVRWGAWEVCGVVFVCSEEKGMTSPSHEIPRIQYVGRQNHA